MPSDAPEMQWNVTRSLPRYVLEIPVSVMMSESATIPITSGRTRDISVVGLSAFLEPPVAIGQRLWLEFRLSESSAPMRLLCAVLYDYGERFGFQFLHITEDQRDQIRQACQGLPHV